MDLKLKSRIFCWLVKNEPAITAGLVILMALAIVGAAEGVAA